MNTNTLSEKATEIVQKLQSEIAQVIERDRVREPKLTPEEKEEIARLEATIAKNRPLMDQFLEPLKEKRARLKALEIDMDKFIINDQAGIDDIVSELVELPAYINVLERCYDSSLRAVSTSEARINRIKEFAREREVRHGQL